jgi:hypothetical protein
MAIAMLLPSVFPKWFTPAGDSVLSGGFLEFYEVGTTTPKSVYADYQQNAPIGNVVTLNGAGEATIFLGSGGYKVILKDQLGAQLDLVDGIFGSGGVGTIPSTANYVLLLNYDELRALSTTVDVAYVAGRTNEGDGGEGWFQRLPGVTAHDDDGVFLSSVGGSIQYRRIFDAAIDPRWYGVEYGSSSDQKDRLEASFPGSAETGCPVLVSKQISIGQNVTVPVGAIIECSQDGLFYGANPVSMTFEAGSRFSGIGACFIGSVQPTFAAGTISELRLSWFGGADGSKWTRAIASTSAKVAFKMDVSTSVTSSVAVPSNLPLTPENGAILTFAAPGDLSIGALNHSTTTQFVSYGLDNYILSVSIGSPVCYMEWFGGAVGNTGNQNAIPFRACMKAQRLDLMGGSVTYTVTSTNPLAYSNPGVVQFVGNSSTININQDLDITVVETNQITIGGSGTFNVGAGVFRNSLILMKLTGGAKSARNSQLSDVNKIVQSNDSTIYGGLTAIEGRLDNCTITLPGTVAVNDGYTFTGCKFIKNEAQHLPAFSFPITPTHQIFQSCSFDIDGALLYSENTNLAVDLVACTDSDNWTKGIHNGYAAVNLIGCDCRGNSTATTVDGVGCRILPFVGDRGPYPMDLTVGNFMPSGTLTGWHGLGASAISTDGKAITFDEDVALGSSVWGMDTLRYTGFTAGITIATMDKVWRYGGQLRLEVEYPAGSPPDPTTRLRAAFVTPRLNNPADNLLLTEHHIHGVSTGVSLAPVASAKLIDFVNIWGGQVTIKTPNVEGRFYRCQDEWADTLLEDWYNRPIRGIPRVVLYNEGGGIIPAGTKIKLYLGAYMPTTEQYRKYWPDTPFAVVNGNATHSVQSPPNGTLWTTPYCFRSGDHMGVEIAKNRPDYGSGGSTPTPVNLPVTVWVDGTTLNGGYS